MIHLEILNGPQVEASFDGGYLRMYTAVAKQMQRETVELRNYVIQNKTTGQMIAQRSGNLNRSLTSEVLEGSDDVTGLVGFPALRTVPYAKILHDGGQTRAHVIEAVNGKCLAFQIGGRTILRKSVNHPGSKFSPRPFLTSALAEQKQKILENISSAMKEALQQ